MPPEFTGLIYDQYGSDPFISSLFFCFFRHRAYNSDFSRQLIDLARNRSRTWDLRRTAILMLEHQMLLLWSKPDHRVQSERLLETLGLLDGQAIRDRVLEEGFTTTEPDGFTSELRNRLHRLNYIHRKIQGFETSIEDLLDFIHVSTRDCKLSLARYVFEPQEIANRILGEVRRTDGLPKENASEPDVSKFDRELAAFLSNRCSVLWVADNTSSELNSLVEYPLTTVALVIKPPGSDLEFEVKRAGMRGPHPLQVLYERNGVPIPFFHRLQGSSTGFMLDFERWASDRFFNIYSKVHGAIPPMSRFLGITLISSLPGPSGQVHLLDYFTQPGAFGADFETMRATLRRCVLAFEGENQRQDLPGEIGWTMRFINHTVPNQAWIAGTSSFRLDRTAKLLSADGPELYFQEGLHREFTPGDSRRLANELLEEVLGVFEAPESPPAEYDEYIDAALAWPPNRTAADAAYLGCIRDLGFYWGTLLAAGGYTEGESFVPRNVGVKSRWENGRWRVRLCFMDHDCLRVFGTQGQAPEPAWAVEGMRKDEDWIRGGDENCPGDFLCLKQIYNVRRAVEAHGEDLFRKHVRTSYFATRAAMQDPASIQHMFDADYVQSLITRDTIIRKYLDTVTTEGSVEDWRTEAEALAGRVYPANLIRDLLDTIVRNRLVLERYMFLYESR